MHCSAIETETLSVCCREFQQFQFLLEEVTESARRRGDHIQALHPLWTERRDIFQDCQSELGTPTKTVYFCKLLLKL